MAINNTTSDFAFMEFPMAFSRQDGFPLDKTSCMVLCQRRRPMPRPPLWPMWGRSSLLWWMVFPPRTRSRTPGELEPLGSAAVSVATDGEVEEMFDEVFGTDANPAKVPDAR